MSPTLGAGGSAGSSDSYSDRQFIAITSEKAARVIALPSQNCVYRQQIADTDYVVKAEIISLKGMRNGFCCFYCICIYLSALVFMQCSAYNFDSKMKWNGMHS